MMDEVIKHTIDHMEKTITVLTKEFQGVRTGRATAVILDRVSVDYYGVPTPVAQVAAIKSPEPQLLVIEPWDKSMIGTIEKAILSSDLGLNPSNDGTLIRLPFPPLTEERRKELVKVCRGYAEDGKVAIRNVRREANDKLKRMEKEGDISQDDLRRAEAEVQKETDKFVARVDDLLKRKEQEILEV
ncbi:MAG: ribosome recycling factor [Actinobacteria bacterium]|nr:ribosome recycling factor [Actinomycetota bacterium]MCL5887556.1 ribosome recycling factor [Actinomycetota bacterium]